MSFRSLLAKLYQYELVKRMKNALRPLKHALFGKEGIYRAMEEVARLHGGADQVRVIFDVGAATGEYAEHFLKYFTRATVYCFEPLPSSFKVLERRTQPYRDRAKLFNYGLSDAEGDATFHVAPYADASSALDKGIPGTVSAAVRMRRLDDVVKELGLTAIDFAKVDVEGTEREVLEGGREAFKNAVASAFIEIQPQFKGYYARAHIEVFDMMQKFGFGFGGAFEDYFFSKRLPCQ
ncbi:MAG: FkbM family methyltransferase [Candidatus Liptonbacteria bacterium]|nr:FkbM family methyltransferase [Candidatus Liptonbacteria bacterium]